MKITQPGGRSAAQHNGGGGGGGGRLSARGQSLVYVLPEEGMELIIIIVSLATRSLDQDCSCEDDEEQKVAQKSG